MKRRFWTPEELEEFRRRYPNERAEDLARAFGRTVGAIYTLAAKIGVRKSAEYLASPAACRMRRGDEIGKATRWKPGQAPWNKGKHYVAGGRSAETRFKKGDRSKRWDPEAYVVGCLRITTDDCLQIRVSEGNSYRDWVQMSRYTWWSETGHWPTPDQVVWSKNGDPHDTRIENLELLSRRDALARNTLWNRYPRKVAEAIQMLGAVTRQINRRERGKDDQRPA